jgi:hypothetical protein
LAHFIFLEVANLAQQNFTIGNLKNGIPFYKNEKEFFLNRAENMSDKELYQFSKRYTLEAFELFGKISSKIPLCIHEKNTEEMIRSLITMTIGIHKQESDGTYKKIILSLCSLFLEFYNEKKIEELNSKKFSTMQFLFKIMECLFAFVRRDLRRTKVSPEEMRLYNNVCLFLDNFTKINDAISA